MPAIILTFVAGTWLATEVTQFLIERYGFADRLIDGLLLLALIMLPATLIIGWRHGQPGRDEWTRDELVLGLGSVAMGLAAAVAVVWLLPGRGDDSAPPLGAKSSSELAARIEVQQAPASGSMLSAALANLEPSAESAFPTVLLMQPEVVAESREQWPWLGIALVRLLVLDLDQEPRMAGQTLYSNRLSMSQVMERGDGLGGVRSVPWARQTAISRGATHFTVGSIDYRDGVYKLAIDLYRVQPAAQLLGVEESGADFYALADRVAIAIRKAALPDLDLTQIDDLPVKSLATESIAALEALARSDLASIKDQDLSAALSQVDRALELDPDFLVADLQRMLVAFALNRADLALQSSTRLVRNQDQLPESLRFLARSFDLQLRGDSAQILPLALRWTEARPRDLTAWQTLASFHATVGDHDEALVAWERYDALRPGDATGKVGAIQSLLAVGRLSEAAAEADALLEVQPEMTVAQQLKLSVLLRQGRLDLARAWLADQQLLNPDLEGLQRSNLVLLALGGPRTEFDAAYARVIEQALDPITKVGFSIIAHELMIADGAWRELVDDLRLDTAAESLANVQYLVGHAEIIAKVLGVERTAALIDRHLSASDPRSVVFRHYAEGVMAATMGDLAKAFAAGDALDAAAADGRDLNARIFAALLVPYLHQANGDHAAYAEAVSESIRALSGVQSFDALTLRVMQAARLRGLRLAGDHAAHAPLLEELLGTAPALTSVQIESLHAALEANDQARAEELIKQLRPVLERATSVSTAAIDWQSALARYAKGNDAATVHGAQP